MKLIFGIIKLFLHLLLNWTIATLALIGTTTLAAELLQMERGLPRMPMILTLAAAIAVWRLLVRYSVSRSAATKSETTVTTAPRSTRRERPKPGPSLHEMLTAPGARENPTNEPRVNELIDESLQLQLKLLRQCHQLTTAAVLWKDPGSTQLSLRGIDSQREDLLPGPFPREGGIVSVLSKGQAELALAPARSGLGHLPYYPDATGVGSLLAIRIGPQTAPDPKSTTPWGILCIDREDTSPWSEDQRQQLRLAARKIELEMQLGNHLKAMDDEWAAVRQVCVGMHELNQGLGLEAAFHATGKAVKALVPADFVAISLVQGNHHRICWADGHHADQLQKVDFPLSSGLVGQVLKYNRSLPENSDYNGANPVFCNNHHFTDFNSLKILPLRKEGEIPVGALTVAAREAQAFSQPQLELLELIAAQSAVKIDLAQAHETINNLAVTDSLTGLANHRAFIHGFEVMLERAQRQEYPMALLMCDVDHFKKVNDSYGHPFGDQVLKEVARCLRKNVRVVDLAARYGGEEFAILMEDSDLNGALLKAEQLRQEVENLPLHRQQEKVAVTLSLGLAVYPNDAQSIEALIDCADQALYQAKAGGRNRSISWGALQQDRLRVQGL
ncbi:MAG: sensor domain-containing diguanylate cyclase [Desulfuromonadaceae bacterium]